VDGQNIDVKCWVNGELRQNSNTKQLIFDIPTLIETLSAGIELQPGDVIATGTPAGVGIGFNPPKFLQTGDVIRIEIENVGVLENEVGE
jgi:2-keto-4-pentenoate hydratase/2-oxohepta-3-ene-1,7-dioic acid hydratase in catechol pathway